MGGGEVVVTGSAGLWAGGEMAGGTLRIGGDAGAFLGAAYPGSRRGMTGGTILVDGSTGPECGAVMRRGLIAVGGTLGASAGRGLIAGTLAAARATGWVVPGMKRGTILLAEQSDEAPILPTFLASGVDRPVFWAVYLRQLRAWGFAPAARWEPGLRMRRYNGDSAVAGQGEVWLAEAAR
jgi:formylmethanofuran dehydrogenase subunit C